jgi:uncharacterized membrane protein YsdA (DUF1294 family)
VALAGAVLVGKLPLVGLGIRISTSVVAFGAYVLDKSAAEMDHWQAKESAWRRD